MPALDWRIIPARSISRCETICASLGFSRNNGRKYSESRIEPHPKLGCRTLGNTGEPVHRGAHPKLPPKNTTNACIHAWCWLYLQEICSQGSPISCNPPHLPHRAGGRLPAPPSLYVQYEFGNFLIMIIGTRAGASNG